MIKAILVDDDYVVRKGLLHIIPWKAFGAEIVGDAENGEQALAFMEGTPVDLVITDLSMPVMNGFELIKRIRERYLHVWIVVLTCHQEFRMIQEALRLGAIDYIVKTELDDDTPFASVGRMIARIREEEKRKEAFLERQGGCDADPWALFLTPVDEEADWSIADRLAVPDAEGADSPIVAPGRGIYIRRETLLREYRHETAIHSAVDPARWIPVFVRGSRTVPEQAIVRLLTNYRDERLFYDYRSDTAAYVVDWQALQRKSVSDERALQALMRQWNDYQWIYDDVVFEDFIRQAREQQPCVEEWIGRLRGTIALWRHLAAIPEAADWHEASGKWRFWEQWAEGLRGIRLRLRHDELSADVCIGVLRALEIVSQDLQSSVSQTEIARRVHLNRSYLSRRFKQYIGKRFQGLLNDLRVERATELLATTNEPVYQIAEKTGFQDEKYFSKFYKQQTGRLPKEVRKD